MIRECNVLRVPSRNVHILSMYEVVRNTFHTDKFNFIFTKSLFLGMHVIYLNLYVGDLFSVYTETYSLHKVR
jgi:hypothetical protein